MSGLILSGDVFIQRDGIDSGLLRLGNTRAFTVSVAEAETLTRKSFSRANYGASLDSYSNPGDHTVAIECDDFDVNTMAMAFLGTSEATSISAASSSATVTLIENQWVDFSDGISATSASITGLTEGTDYAVSLEGGMIMALNSGAAGSQTVDFDTPAVSGYTINAQTQASLRCKVVLLGVNLTSGEQVRFEAEKATLSPSGDLNLLSEDFTAFTLSGILEIAEGAAYPYTVRVVK